MSSFATRSFVCLVVSCFLCALNLQFEFSLRQRTVKYYLHAVQFKSAAAGISHDAIHAHASVFICACCLVVYFND